jgi:hypothetical protein
MSRDPCVTATISTAAAHGAANDEAGADRPEQHIVLSEVASPMFPDVVQLEVGIDAENGPAHPCIFRHSADLRSEVPRHYRQSSLLHVC